NWLLDHVEKIETVRDERETRFTIHEKTLPGKEAPTISAGTVRLIGILTAYYALEMQDPELPGLLVIEEPDTAIHPLLLRRFVELLRSHVKRADRPRQYILTTHNPMLLNLFEPNEVRIVERNEQGITTVHPVDINVAKVWFEEEGAYNL